MCSGRPDAAFKPRRLRLIDVSGAPTPYERIWTLQKRLVRQLRDGTGRETVILTQHEGVYTLGAGSSLSHLRLDVRDLPYGLVRTERGGEVTFHGPGQLVLYPVLKLAGCERDLHAYLRRLEQVVIQALWEVSGIEGRRKKGLTGVWVGDAKLAAVGIRATRWVTYHGVALNVAMDLTPYDAVVPCGIADGEVTCIRDALDLASSADPAFDRALLREYRVALLEAFSDVFDAELDVTDAVLVEH